MNKNDILQKTIALFATMTEAEEITAQSELMEDLDLSSMDVMIVVSSLEEEFGIKVPEMLLQNVETVGDVATMVTDLMK